VRSTAYQNNIFILFRRSWPDTLRQIRKASIEVGVNCRCARVRAASCYLMPWYLVANSRIDTITGRTPESSSSSAIPVLNPIHRRGCQMMISSSGSVIIVVFVLLRHGHGGVVSTIVVHIFIATARPVERKLLMSASKKGLVTGRGRGNAVVLSRGSRLGSNSSLVGGALGCSKRERRGFEFWC